MSDLLPSDGGYRVLARKYRPANFDSLIGQEAMVRTLGNAIARGALAHAWLLTGVRGVGKTSTARIIAKALNCIGPDGQGGPTISPCGECDPCQAIAAGRHIDVVEMDAASNTGVDDVREIIEAVRYAAVSARFKIYIIDEVHMLSKNAFNALLKTLEEPPAHVKFIFATTEVQKVPITVLSRCQRFDLRRIPQEKLVEHFGRVAAAEKAEVDAEALELVARAAEGSVRDGLSILDQAISHGHGAVTAQAVRDMLGLSDRGRVRELMGLLLAGDARGTLENLRAQYDLGVNPDMVMQELLELTHTVTRAKVAGGGDATLAEADRASVRDWAERLAFPALHRLWQLLLKGLAEVQSAPLPIQAAEMALLRVVHASSLPDPSDLVRRLTQQGGDDAPREEAPAREPEPELRMAAAPPPTPAPVPLRPEAPAPETVAMPASFAALVELFDGQREPLLAQILHDRARLVRYAPPLLELNLAGSRPDVAQQLMRCLQLWTGERWTVTLTDKDGEPTLLEIEQAAMAAERQAVLDDPAVRKLMSVFPEAELIDYGVDPEAAAAAGTDEDMRSA
ncbi:DNA polymerase III subunit gamma/tau [Sphingoaurantiacus capsulatus]|uniref:DNA polymerase III subunit gamma/tau n=1 Tax=Sphingoaurantiacus capsulatus TaxID=1771310 RepID=A0ABV7XDH5_9SPHN